MKLRDTRHYRLTLHDPYSDWSREVFCRSVAEAMGKSGAHAMKFVGDRASGALWPWVPLWTLRNIDLIELELQNQRWQSEGDWRGSATCGTLATIEPVGPSIEPHECQSCGGSG